MEFFSKLSLFHGDLQISSIVAPPLPAPLPTATESDMAGSTVLDLGEQDESGTGGLFSLCTLL